MSLCGFGFAAAAVAVASAAVAAVVAVFSSFLIRLGFSTIIACMLCLLVFEEAHVFSSLWFRLSIRQECISMVERNMADLL